MEIRNKCVVCKSDIGKYRCKMCNSIVCAECYNKKAGLCIICKDGLVI